VTENGIFRPRATSLLQLPGTSSAVRSMPAFFSLNSAQRS
jgi:hypothetical protein